MKDVKLRSDKSLEFGTQQCQCALQKGSTTATTARVNRKKTSPVVFKLSLKREKVKVHETLRGPLLSYVLTRNFLRQVWKSKVPSNTSWPKSFRHLSDQLRLFVLFENNNRISGNYRLMIATGGVEGEISLPEYSPEWNFNPSTGERIVKLETYRSSSLKSTSSEDIDTEGSEITPSGFLSKREKPLATFIEETHGQVAVSEISASIGASTAASGHMVTETYDSAVPLRVSRPQGTERSTLSLTQAKSSGVKNLRIIALEKDIQRVNDRISALEKARQQDMTAVAAPSTPL